MGQQQLLLVILVTIIVGIATVVAINTFGSAADQANIDAVTNDVATLASAAQGYYMRPGMLGGGGRTFDGTGTPESNGISFRGLAFPANAIDQNDFMTAQNENGRYVIGDVTSDSFTITAHPGSCNGYQPGAVADAADGDTEAGDLTGGADCDDPIVATVTANSFSFND